MKNRDLLCKNLKNYIRDSGFTKYSICKKINIPVSELEAILNNETDDSSFKENLQKILRELNITKEKLLLYIPKTVQNDSFTNNFTEKAKKQYDLLLNILDLCAIYY